MCACTCVIECCSRRRSKNEEGAGIDEEGRIATAREGIINSLGVEDVE